MSQLPTLPKTEEKITYPIPFCVPESVPLGRASKIKYLRPFLRRCSTNDLRRLKTSTALSGMTTKKTGISKLSVYRIPWSIGPPKNQFHRTIPHPHLPQWPSPAVRCRLVWVAGWAITTQMPLPSPQAHVTLIALTGVLVPTRITRGGVARGNATP